MIQFYDNFLMRSACFILIFEFFIHYDEIFLMTLRNLIKK